MPSGIGYHTPSGFYPSVTVGEQIAEPVEVQRRVRANPRSTRVRTQSFGLGQFITRTVLASQGYVREASRERAVELLEQVGSPDPAERVDEYPLRFSGDMLQRAMVAQALAGEPDVVVCDEPVSPLEVPVQAQIRNLLADLQTKFDLTYLFIAHDRSGVRHISDRVAVMNLGEIVERGPVAEIFEDPQRPYTKALLASVPRADVSEHGRRVDVLPGDVPSPRDPPSGCRFHTRCGSAREACRRDAPDDDEVGADHSSACFRASEDNQYWDSEPLEHAEAATSRSE